MGTRLSISALARQAQVPVSTVRYYERIGLVRPAGRTDGNYRYYTQDALERLRFVRAARSAGFTVGDVATLLALRDGSLAPCDDVQTVIQHRLDDVAGKISDFRRVQRELEASLALCRAASDAAHCEVIDKLTAAASAGRAPKKR
jgi:DNA-binding transcriptional MerR regulator